MQPDRDADTDALPGKDFSGVTRNILERVRLPDGTRDLILAEVTYAPGVEAPAHRHPVGGLVYIIEGVAESAYGDETPRQYRSGETLQDRADAVHRVFRNCDADRALRFLTVYALEPGQSYTTKP